MKSKILLSIALTLLCSFSVFALQQEAELSLYTKITDAIEKKEPEWELSRKAIMSNQVIIRWVSKKGRVHVAVAMLAPEVDAKEALKSRVDVLQNIPESKVSKNELKNFGDEGYILRTEGVSGITVIFRKGSYMVQVFAPSEEIAKRFSQHICDLRLTFNNSFNRVS